MKPFTGFEAKKSQGRETLPAGGYVAKILDAKEARYDWGDVLVLSFDILEGEHKNFFAADYKAQDQEDKKWRGTFRITLPKDDGSERDTWTKRGFNNSIWAIEESNPGYKFDWDEQKFKGKTVGVLFRNREWEMNGSTGWTTECCKLTSVQEIRENAFQTPKDKPLPAKPATPAFAPVEDMGDLPF